MLKGSMKTYGPKTLFFPMSCPLTSEIFLLDDATPQSKAAYQCQW